MKIKEFDEVQKKISLAEDQNLSVYFDKNGIKLYIHEKDSNEIEKNIQKLYINLKQEFYNSYTFETFKKKLLDYFINNLNNSNFNIFKSEIYKKEREEYFVYREISGVCIKDKIDFKGIKIYNYENKKDEIKKKYPEKFSKHFITLTPSTKCLIEVKIKAREVKRAIELSEEKIEEFINLLYVMYNLDSRYIMIEIGKKVIENQISYAINQSEFYGNENFGVANTLNFNEDWCYNLLVDTFYFT